MASTALALGSVLNAEPESARWSPISSIYVASSPANSLAPNESVQCIRSLDQMSWYNVAYLCEETVAVADQTQDINTAHEALGKSKDGSITEAFE